MRPSSLRVGYARLEKRRIAITSRLQFLPRPIAAAALAMFRHKEDDRVCDAAFRDNSFCDVNCMTRLRVAHGVINEQKMLQETRYRVRV